MSQPGYIFVPGGSKPGGPIQADPNPVSSVLPPDWRESLNLGLPESQKKHEEKVKEVSKSPNTGYLVVGLIFLVAAIGLTIYKWPK
jgi:hypothetical protein